MEELRALIQRFGNTGGKIAWDCRFAGYQVERTLLHLDFAKADVESVTARYRSAEEAFLDNVRVPVGVRRLTEHDMAIHDEYTTAAELLPFRIEVYFTQARMVLDRVARLLSFAFRPGSSEIGSHSSVERLLPRLVAEHSLEVPPSLIDRIAALTHDVKIVRDRYIVHPQGPHGHLIRRVAELEEHGEVRLKIKWASPEGECIEPTFSQDVSSLDAAVRDYIREVISLIRSRPCPSEPSSGIERRSLG